MYQNYPARFEPVSPQLSRLGAGELSHRPQTSAVETIILIRMTFSSQI